MSPFPDEIEKVLHSLLLLASDSYRTHSPRLIKGDRGCPSFNPKPRPLSLLLVIALKKRKGPYLVHSLPAAQNARRKGLGRDVINTRFWVALARATGL